MAALALAVVAGLVVFASAMRGSISDAGNGVADAFAALSGEGGSGGGSGGEGDEPQPDPENGTMFAVYSEDDNSLDFYKRDRLPAVGDTFCGKSVTAVWKGLEFVRYNMSSQVPWYNNYRTLITSICVVDDGCKPESVGRWFYGLANATSFDLAKLDTSKITNLSNTFTNCRSLTSLDLSDWNTSSCESIYQTFFGCSRLSYLNLSGWDTSRVTSFHELFFNCRSLKSLDLSGWDTSRANDTLNMFYNCPSLTDVAVGPGWTLGEIWK